MNLGGKRAFIILVLAVGLAGTTFLFQLATVMNLQWDFTEEKRYTLHPAVSEMPKGINQDISIEVFLSGELPNNFKRFSEETRVTLERFSKIAGSNFQFKFTDPSLAEGTQARNQYYRSLIDRGLQPSNVSYTEKGQKTEKLVFPGIIISSGVKEIPVNLLKGNRSKSIDEMLNQSVEGLEFEIANGIKQLREANRKKIGIITGHGGLDSLSTAGFTNSVLTKYDLYKIDLPRRRAPLLGYDAIVIAKPSEAFSELEKYLLDQYVMNGGNLMFFIDALNVDLQQAHGEGTIAIPYETNLEDLLFRYGLRVNGNYVADVNCGNTPVVTGNVGDQPRIELLPWPYFPIITNYGSHELVRNLDATWVRGASTLDTVKADGIKKSPLLLTSTYTRVFSPPVRISYNDLQTKLKPDLFTSGTKVLGYLLEGKFSSLYANRFPPKGSGITQNRKNSIGSKIIVVSDGDFIRNDFNLENENPLPLGVDAYSQTTYANENFLMNGLDYLVENDQLLLARNRSVQIRPLDKVKVQEDGELWRWINVVSPLVVVVSFGILNIWVRRKRYGKG